MAARLFKKNANTPLPTTISHPSDMITQVAKPSKQKSALGNLFGFTKCFAMLKTFNPKSKSTINPKVKTTPAKLGPQPEHLKGRKTLILDLDETLVHSTLEYTRSPDFVLPLSIKGVTHLISIHKRPGVEYFLERVCQLFEVVIFTASLEDYAKPLIKKIDRTNQISSFLYRGDCTVFNNILVKDLSTLGRDLKDIILIDNSANSFLFQPQNAYQIKDFFDDKKDQELAKLLPFLEHLAQVDDVRSISGHYRAFEKMQSSRTGSLTCVSENTSLNHNNHNNEIGPIAALNLDIKESGRTLSSNRQLVRSDTETELLAAATTTIAATEPDVRITNADEREAWRIVKALSLRQKAMIRNSSRLKEMGPLSISANPKSSSTSAGSSADRETDTSPFSHRRLGDLEDDDKSSGKKEKSIFAKKIFEFPEGNKENYVKFENEIEEDVKENRGTQNMGV